MAVIVVALTQTAASLLSTGIRPVVPSCRSSTRLNRGRYAYVSDVGSVTSRLRRRAARRRAGRRRRGGLSLRYAVHRTLPAWSVWRELLCIVYRTMLRGFSGSSQLPGKDNPVEVVSSRKIKVGAVGGRSSGRLAQAIDQRAKDFAPCPLGGLRTRISFVSQTQYSKEG